MSKKEHVYELIDHSKGDKVVAEFWWNGRKVDCSSPALLDSVRKASYKFTPNQGIPFLENLPKVFTNGYLQIRKKKDQDAD